MKIITGHNPLTGKDFPVIIGTNEDKLAFLRKKYGPILDKDAEFTGDAQCITVPTADGNDRLLWFKRVSTTPEDLGLIMHEILHFVFAELRDMGVKPSEDSEEVYTYFMQNIVVNLFDVMKRTSRPKRRI